MDEGRRRILHVDLDAFFAQVEMLRRPALRGQPVVIGGVGDPTRRGVVSTASYEARRAGVRSGMPLRTAARLCPEAVFLPVDFAAYRAMSARFKAILREFSEVVEEGGIDEAFLDVSSSARAPEEIAREIRRRVRADLGLTCSVGVAWNKLLAKIASDMEKPDGLTVIRAGDVEARVWPLGVRKLLGVGPKTEERLHAMGVRTIGDLARVPPGALAGEFGPAHGAYLARAARGVDNSPLVTEWEPKSMSRETTFEHDVADRDVVRATLRELAEDVAASLRKAGYRARNVTVKLRYADFETHTRGTTLPAGVDSGEAIAEAALRCLARFPGARDVRLVGVRAGRLEPLGGGGP